MRDLEKGVHNSNPLGGGDESDDTTDDSDTSEEAENE
jgi:hypothetical protein